MILSQILLGQIMEKVISLIVARTQNHIIGKDNQMPWHLPADLAWFRQNTLGKPVIMGRKTYESIGRLLPKRPNIILSRSGFMVEGAISATSLEEALTLAENLSEEIMIIGGGELFKQALPLAKRLYLTEIQAEIEGDTTFEFDETNWQAVSSSQHFADPQNSYACHFQILERIAK